MKKYIALSLLLIVGQSYALDTKLALAQLAQLVKLIEERGLNETTINTLYNRIPPILNYAFQNSKTITGAQDIHLVKVISLLEYINKEVFQLNRNKNKDLAILNRFETDLITANQSIARTYLTPSKRNAQLILQKMIILFVGVLFPIMKEAKEMEYQFR